LAVVGFCYFILSQYTAWDVAYCHSCGLAVSAGRPAKMAEVIEMPFAMWTREAKSTVYSIQSLEWACMCVC